MTEPDTQPLNNQQERFPDRHIVRAFRLAVYIPQVLSAAAAVFVLAAGLWVIDWLPFAPKKLANDWRWERPLVSGWNSETGELAAGAVRENLQHFGEMLLWPVTSVISPALELFTIGNSWSEAAYAWTRLLWGLAVWAFFTAAMTRMSAVKFAARQSVGLSTAWQFAGRRFLSFFTAPLLPTVGILFFWLLLLVGGWIGRIPGAGPILLAAFWFLAVGIGLLAALIAVGVVAGWPMMAPTISTEVSDGFDGFSRAFSYVYSRPWQLARLYLLSAIVGIVGVAAVVIVASLVVHVTVWGISGGMGIDAAAWLTDGSPFALYTLTNAEATAGAAAVSEFAGSLAMFWLNAASLLVHGFAVSLFWSLMTLVYFAIRNIDDATSLDEVFLTEAEQAATGLPAIGVPDFDAPLSERPLEKDAGEETPADTGLS